MWISIDQSFWIQVAAVAVIAPCITLVTGGALKNRFSPLFAHGLGAVLAAGLLFLFSLFALSMTYALGNGWGGLVFGVIFAVEGGIAVLGVVLMLLAVMRGVVRAAGRALAGDTRGVRGK